MDVEASSQAASSLPLVVLSAVIGSDGRMIGFCSAVATVSAGMVCFSRCFGLMNVVTDDAAIIQSCSLRYVVGCPVVVVAGVGPINFCSTAAFRAGAVCSSRRMVIGPSWCLLPMDAMTGKAALIQPSSLMYLEVISRVEFTVFLSAATLLTGTWNPRRM